MKLNKVIIVVILGIILSGAGLAAGFFVFRQPAERLKDKTSNAFEFINPTVNSNLNKYFIINFKPLRLELEKIQKKYSQRTYIYFLYLNSGAWVGLNEREEFTAASTIKTPLAMSVYKMIENGKLKPIDSYTLEELDLNSDFGQLYKVGSDRSFIVEELIKIMLEESDNTAMNAIYNISMRLGVEDPLGSIYDELGWQFLTPPALDETPNYSKINLKALSNMFLALYNSTFLEPKHSQQILEYLNNSPFDDKIVAGAPKDVPVAHKIGISASDETFSDCGIVYAPNRNYILCLGSNGGDEKSANKFMAEVSKAVYNYVINN